MTRPTSERWQALNVISLEKADIVPSPGSIYPASLSRTVDRMMFRPARRLRPSPSTDVP